MKRPYCCFKICRRENVLDNNYYVTIVNFFRQENSDAESTASCPEKSADNKLVTSTTSVQDYFAIKMKQLKAAQKAKLSSQQHESVAIDEDLSDDTSPRIGFVFKDSQKSETSLVTPSIQFISGNEEKSEKSLEKRKKKKRKCNDLEHEQVIHGVEQSSTHDVNQELQKKRKKERKKDEDDVKECNSSSENSTNHEAVCNFARKKKKKCKKSKSKSKPRENAEQKVRTNSQREEHSETKSTKQKKCKKSKKELGS